MTEKIVELGFTFEYAESAGKDRSIAIADSVTVRAPSLSDLHIHTHMVAYVDKALAGVFALQNAQRPEKQTDQDFSDTDQDDDDDSHDVMQIMSMGLGVDGFPDFVTYARKSLTRKPSLAYVGDKQPLNDETWDAIAEAGGIEGALKIVAAFTDFFMISRIEALSRNGKGGSTSSAKPTQDSAQSKPKPSRSKS